MSSAVSSQKGLYRLNPVRRVARWLDALPHPELVCEIAADRVAAARWGRHKLEAFAAEPLPEGAVNPSPVQPNMGSPEAVAGAVRRVLGRTRGRRREVALLVPDAVVRIFILAFETLPRRASQAASLLRWRLKKSIPFEAEETEVSWIRQPGRGGELEVVAAVARQSIVREYEQAVQAAGMLPGVVLSSTLAALPLVEDHRVVLLARLNGTFLTTAILAGNRLAVYRCTGMAADGSHLEVSALLGEVYPLVAYYQDSAHENVAQLLLGGAGGRFEEFREALVKEVNCPVSRLAPGAGPGERLPADAAGLLAQQLDGLVGWQLNRGA